MSTQPSSLASRRSSSEYDPTNPQPYTAPQLPEPTSPEVPQVAQQQTPQSRGPINSLGGIAQIGDQLLRGFMRGKSDAQQARAIKLKRQSDNMQAAYNMAAQNLKTLHDQGVDPNSDQYKQAKAAVDGSWSALIQFYGQHVSPSDPGMGGKKKSSKAPQKGILERLRGDDPMEVSQAWYQVMQKLGPPVMYQLGDQKQMQQRRDTAALKGQNEYDAAKMQHRIFELQSKPNLTADEQAELTRLTTKPVQPQPGDETLRAKDEIAHKIKTDPNYEPSESEMRLMGWQQKPTFHYGRNGEVIATSIGEDGQPTYDVLRPGQQPAGPQAKPIPAATTGAWQKQKDDDIAYARQLWLQGDKKGNKISYDEYLNQWQAAQDSFEGKYKNAGHQVPHVDIRQNVDKNGNWTGAGMAQSARNNPQEIPSGVMSGGGSSAANLGKESLGVPEGMVRVQLPGHSPGLIKKDRLDDFKAQYPNATVF